MDKLKPPMQEHRCKTLENCESISIAKRLFGGKERWMWERSEKNGSITADEITFCPYCGADFDHSAVQENTPLTLEQLRKMCKPTLTQLQQTEPYAPVWIVTLGDKKISCQITRGLIKTDNRCKPPKEYIDVHMVGLLLSDYGKTWLAYAHKPEGSEHP